MYKVGILIPPVIDIITENKATLFLQTFIDNMVLLDTPLISMRNTVTTYNRKYYQSTSYARNSYKKWTQEEDRIVLEHTIPDREISKLLGGDESNNPKTP